MNVRITRVAVAHPPGHVAQRDVPGLMGAKGLDAIRARAVARGSRIRERRLVVPPDELRELETIAQRNEVYKCHAPSLGVEAFGAALGERERADVRALVTSSCTGYMLPSLAVELAGRLGLCGDTTRLPITEAGCAGGVVALARAADYVASRPGAVALAGSVELCTLSFHHSRDEGVLTANLIFGDGAGAAVVEDGTGPGLEIIDSASVLLPRTRHLLGFDLTDHGFYPVLARELVDVLPGATMRAVAPLLARQGLSCGDVGAWLLHPGGSRILSRIEKEMSLRPEQTRWSWESLRDYGNTSSAAIFDVVRRYLETPRGEEWAVAVAFGPGVSIELLLVRRRC